MGPPPERQGPGGPGQGSDGGQYWGEEGGYQEGWRRGPGDSRSHRGGSGSQWESQEMFSSHDEEYMGHDGYFKFNICLMSRLYSGLKGKILVK